MKKPKCPSCGKAIARTLGVRVYAETIYYINRQACGYVWFPGHWNPLHLWKRNKDSREAFQGLYCRYCSKSFPKDTEKKIFKYLKQDAVIRKLTSA